MLDEVAGTPVFSGERAHAGYPLNRMAMSLTDAANRAAFVADETGYTRCHCEFTPAIRTRPQ